MSHQDSDFLQPKSMPDELSKHLEDLKNKAEELSRQRANLITAGAQDEPVLYEKTIDGMLVRQLPDDPLRILRISIGQSLISPEEWPDNSYVVFRGDPGKVQRLLLRVLRSLSESGVLEGGAP